MLFKQINKIRTTLLVAIMSLAACSLTPDYERPDTTIYLGENYEQSNSISMLEDDAAISWWKGFNDPIVDTLIEQALVNNLDLQVAAANVLESEALVRSRTGSRWPQVNATFSTERSLANIDTGFGTQRNYTTNIQLAGSIAWQADLFGKLRSAEKAAIADWQASQTDRIALIHTVIANVIRQRVQLAIAIQRLTVAEDILRSREDTLGIVSRRYKQGVATASAVDLRLARENVYSAEASIAAQEQSVTLAQYALDVLLGKKPGVVLENAGELTLLPELTDAITGVPAQLIDRRPDLRAAEFRVIASNERIGVAMADLYPDVTLSASGGWSDSELAGLFSPTTLFASILGQLSQSIFSGGQLQAEVDAAEARLASQAKNYASDVLTAVQEVEDALFRNEKLKQRQDKVKQQLTEARLAEELSRKRYSRGVESLLTVLETERRRQIAEDSLLQIQLDYWNARVDLYLALGGDWLDGDYESFAKR